MNPDDYRKLNAALRWSRGDGHERLHGHRSLLRRRLELDGPDPGAGGRRRQRPALRRDRPERRRARAPRQPVRRMAGRSRRPADARLGVRAAQRAQPLVELHVPPRRPGARRPVRAGGPALRARPGASHQWSSRWGGRTADTRIGAGAALRRHRQRGPLRDARARAARPPRARTTVGEASLFAFAESTYAWTSHLRSTLGLRGDYYFFDVASDVPVNSGSRRAGLLSPKLGLAFGPWGGTEVYANAGFGFHSNDARGTTIRVDPRTGEPAAAVDPLVRAKGAELGVRTLAIPKAHATLALWGLDLDSEQLYVGDAGTTEASRPSRRLGFECAVDYVPRPWLDARRELRLVARPLHGRRPGGRPHPLGDRGRRERRHRAHGTAGMAREPALAILRPARARRGRQRAFEARPRLHGPGRVQLQTPER